MAQEKLPETLDPTIHAILLLDNSGKRIAVKYYSGAFQGKVDKQLSFEKRLHKKTNKKHARIDEEVLLFENMLILYKFTSDVCMVVLSDIQENELIILSVLKTLDSSLKTLLKNQVDQKTLVSNVDLVLLVLDEMIDSGVIFELDSSKVAPRVAMRSGDKSIPLSEQTFAQAFQHAREQISKSWR